MLPNQRFKFSEHFCNNFCNKFYENQKIENYYPISDRYYNTFSSSYNKDSLKLYSRPFYEYDYCNYNDCKFKK